MNLIYTLISITSNMLCVTSNHYDEMSPVTMNSIGIVGSYGCNEYYGYPQDLKYYILTKDSLFILKEEPSDEIFGEIIKFQGAIEKKTGKLQLNDWKVDKVSPFQLQLKGTIINTPRSKQSSPYFKIDAAFTNKSILFHFDFLNSSHIRIKENVSCTIHAQPRVINKSKFSNKSDINEIIATSEINTNTIYLKSIEIRASQ